MNILETKNLCRYFGGLKAVNNISIQVEQGKIYGIIGPNGAGKTTFFNVCAGTYSATSGEVWLGGENITNRKPEYIAHIGLARTFQNLKLFSYMTVSENIAVGFHIHTRTNIFDAILMNKRYRQDEELIKVKTRDVLERLELKEYSNERAGNLSYGIQRKVEIARAMALEPKILLLDEPAAGMNPNETNGLLKFVKMLNAQGCSIIVIEHDMKFIMNLCDQVMVMNYGEKICQGPPEDIRNNREVQEAYLGKGLDFSRRKNDGAKGVNQHA